MSRLPLWVVPCLLIATVLCCVPKATPERAPSPPSAEPPPAATAEELRARRAAILRAEDRRVVDETLQTESAAPEAEMRARAATALGRIGDRRFWKIVAGLAGDPNPRVRAEAAFALGLLEDRRGVTALRELARDSGAAVRRNAAFALGFLGAEETRPEMLALLQDDDASVAMAAAAAVTRFSNAEFAVDRLLSMAESTESNVRSAAVRAVADLASRARGSDFGSRKRARDWLIELAGTEDPKLRALAATGLAVPATSDEIETLAGLFEAEEPRVRINVVGAVSFPGAPVDPFLGQAVLDSSEGVVLAALRGLGRLRGIGASNVLAGFIVTDQRDWLRAEAVLALADVEPEELADMAKSASAAEARELREAAARLLWGRQDAESIAVARELFRDPDPGVRQAAVRAMAGAPEPLAELLADLIGTDDAATFRATAGAAGIRLGLPGRTADDRDQTAALLDTFWKQACDTADPVSLGVVLEAAVRGGDHAGSRAILKAGMDHPDRFVASKARELWTAVGGEQAAHAPAPATDRPLEDYVEILQWAAEPRAAIVTVERPGFIPGRFTVRLDTENTPLTAWNFARLAEEGFYDGLPFHRLVPNSILQTGDPDGDGLGGPGYVIRDEIHPHEFDAGTLAMALPARDGSGSQWFVTLDASPALARTHTAFGRVVRNFPGVAARVLPTDRVVSVVVYEGDGTEPLPPLERAGLGSSGVSAGPS